MLLVAFLFKFLSAGIYLRVPCQGVISVPLSLLLKSP